MIGTRSRLWVLLPLAVFLFLVAVSWNRWVEPFVDTGRELMVPWRVAQGEALYRDVRFYYGPLGPYLAAALDLLFGRSFPARIGLAAVIAVIHMAALAAIARRLLPAGEAALATALAVGVAFFLRPGGCHLFPYSLDTAIAVASVTVALGFAHSGGSRSRDRVAGAFLLAALLARPETGLAGIIALGIERFALANLESLKRLRALVLVPVGIAAALYVALSISTPLPILKREGWLTFLFLPEEFRNVYAAFSGLDQPGLRLAELGLALIAAVAVVLWLLVAAALSKQVESRSGLAARGIEVFSIAVLVVVAYLRLRPPASLQRTADLFPPLVRVVPPLIAAAAVFGLVRRLWDRSRSRLPTVAGIPDSILLIALLFAGRLFLAAGYVGPYAGFYLPLPIVVTFAILLNAARRVPERFDAGARPTGFPALVLAGLCVFLFYRLAVLSLAYRYMTWTEVRTPAGAIYFPSPAGETTRPALAYLARRVPADRGVVTLPEAGFFNWVLGRRNPLAQDQFFPGHLDAAAEDEAIARLRRDPPAAVVYADVLTIGHGRVAFGRDYLRRLDAYVRENFVAVASWGPGAGPDPRIGDPSFFIQVRVPAPRR